MTATYGVDIRVVDLGLDDDSGRFESVAPQERDRKDEYTTSKWGVILKLLNNNRLGNQMVKSIEQENQRGSLAIETWCQWLYNLREDHGRCPSIPVNVMSN
jgi:hypothetical protein